MIRNKLLRKKVFERDGGICCVRGCGRYDPKWEADHVVPLSMGGRDDLDNLVTRCRHHHKEKTKAEAPVRAKTDRLALRHQQMKRRRAVGGGNG